MNDNEKMAWFERRYCAACPRFTTPGGDLCLGCGFVGVADAALAAEISDNRPSLKDSSPEDVRTALNVPPYPDASEKQD